MAFKFSLESLLKHRKREEDIAQREYFEAQANVNSALSEIDDMYAAGDNARQEIVRLQLESTGPEHLAQIEEFIAGLKIRIERRRAEARDLMTIVEEKQDALRLKAQDFKTIEKLKERQFHAHRIKLKKEDQKITDEINVMRHKRTRA